MGGWGWGEGGRIMNPACSSGPRSGPTNQQEVQSLPPFFNQAYSQNIIEFRFRFETYARTFIDRDPPHCCCLGPEIISAFNSQNNCRRKKIKSSSSSFPPRVVVVNVVALLPCAKVSGRYMRINTSNNCGSARARF